MSLFTKRATKGFTLIELMVVMVIMSLLISVVGPLSVRSLDKAEAKQEMLGLKNLLVKVSERSFYHNKKHILHFNGKSLKLFSADSDEALLTKSFTSLFFFPVTIEYNQNGFVKQKMLTGTYRGNSIELDLEKWVNSQKQNANLEIASIAVDK